MSTAAATRQIEDIAVSSKQVDNAVVGLKWLVLGESVVDKRLSSSAGWLADELSNDAVYSLLQLFTE